MRKLNASIALVSVLAAASTALAQNNTGGLLGGLGGIGIVVLALLAFVFFRFFLNSGD